MNTIPQQNLTAIYILSMLYFLTMTAGFLLILQTEFPQIGFDNDLSTITVAFAETRVAVILSHLSLRIGFFLFFPLARFISNNVGLRTHSLSDGLLNASVSLRMLPWLGVLPLYLFLNSQSSAELPGNTLVWNGLFLLLNTLGEDIGVNLLTGSWAVIVSLALWNNSSAVSQRFAAALGIVLGALFVISAGELIGVDLIQAGNPIATLISPLLSLWVIGLAIMLVRQHEGKFGVVN